MPTRKTRAAEAGVDSRSAGPAVTVSGRHPPLGRRTVERAVRTVVAGERFRGRVAVTFVGPATMRRLNLAWKGRDRPTDVLAFSLPLPDGTMEGDVYVCRAVAVAEAKSRSIPVGEELLRLVVHGVLHVAGHDHPETAARTGSPMWRRQERYLRCLA